MRSYLFNLAALAVVLTSAHAANSDAFYVTSPACQNEGCTVDVQPGSSLNINWLNPIKGKINIRLVPEETNKSAKTVKIATKIGAHRNAKSCDKFDAKSCGSFNWSVPTTVKAGQYSIDIHSLADKSVHGYSDIITITSPDAAASTNQTSDDQTTQTDPTTSNSPNKAYTAMGRPIDRHIRSRRAVTPATEESSKKKKDSSKKKGSTRKDTTKKDSTKKDSTKKTDGTKKTDSTEKEDGSKKEDNNKKKGLKKTKGTKKSAEADDAKKAATTDSQDDTVEKKKKKKETVKGAKDTKTKKDKKTKKAKKAKKDKKKKKAGSTSNTTTTDDAASSSPISERDVVLTKLF